jgi:hypothetical protein
MRYQDYLELVRVAKWSLTFGEGMDDYFVATPYRGGVGFAVYNDDFFTSEFKGLRTVFPDWETLSSKITDEIRALDNKDSMEAYNACLRPLLTKYWSRTNTKNALECFYQDKFTLP